MANYLITGASRGIGLELTKQLLSSSSSSSSSDDHHRGSSQVGKVFALSRGATPSPALQVLINQYPGRIIYISASVTSTDSVLAAAKEVEKKLLEGEEGEKEGLDVLVNNAGQAAYHPRGMKTVEAEVLTRLLDVNVVGVQRVIAAFLPLLERGVGRKVVNISSTLGSVSWAKQYHVVPSYAYKVTKSALHMINAQYAFDLADQGFTVFCISPGWLKTDLGGENADLEVEVGVKEVKRIILESGREQNGKFLNIHIPGQEDGFGRYDGGEIAW